MEYSLTRPSDGKYLSFATFRDLIYYLQLADEVDGWILRIHHM